MLIEVRILAALGERELMTKRAQGASENWSYSLIWIQATSMCSVCEVQQPMCTLICFCMCIILESKIYLKKHSMVQALDK